MIKYMTEVIIYRLHTRVDNRGSLEYVFDENTVDFKALETRIYSMPKEGTFFGIHYREESSPMTKRQRCSFKTDKLQGFKNQS